MELAEQGRQTIRQPVRIRHAPADGVDKFPSFIVEQMDFYLGHTAFVAALDLGGQQIRDVGQFGSGQRAWVNIPLLENAFSPRTRDI